MLTRLFWKRGRATAKPRYRGHWRKWTRTDTRVLAEALQALKILDRFLSASLGLHSLPFSWWSCTISSFSTLRKVPTGLPHSMSVICKLLQTPASRQTASTSLWSTTFDWLDAPSTMRYGRAEHRGGCISGYAVRFLRGLNGKRPLDRLVAPWGRIVHEWEVLDWRHSLHSWY